MSLLWVGTTVSWCLSHLWKYWCHRPDLNPTSNMFDINQGSHDILPLHTALNHSHYQIIWAKHQYQTKVTEQISLLIVRITLQHVVYFWMLWPNDMSPVELRSDGASWWWKSFCAGTQLWPLVRRLLHLLAVLVFYLQVLMSVVQTESSMSLLYFGVLWWMDGLRGEAARQSGGTAADTSGPQ